MKMCKKMVVGVDGSAPSLNALKESLMLASREGNEVLAISVVPPYEGDLSLFGVKNIKALLREPREKALAVTKGAAESVKVNVRTLCAEGVPHEEIIALVESEDCDLIVMGTKGYSLPGSRCEKPVQGDLQMTCNAMIAGTHGYRRLSESSSERAQLS